MPPSDRPRKAQAGAGRRIIGHVLQGTLLPVLQNRCQECHRPGRSGGRSAFLNVQASGAMGRPDQGVHGEPRHCRRGKPSGGPGVLARTQMPKSEIDMLAAWVDAGCPEGKPRSGPRRRRSSPAPRSGHLGKARSRDRNGRGVSPSARPGPDHFRARVVMPTGLTEDKMIVAYEVKPGNPPHCSPLDQLLRTRPARPRSWKRPKKDRQKKMRASRIAGRAYTSAMGHRFHFRSGPNGIGGIGGWTPGSTAGSGSRPAPGTSCPRAPTVVVQMPLTIATARPRRIARASASTSRRTPIGAQAASTSSWVARTRLADR